MAQILARLLVAVVLLFSTPAAATVDAGSDASQQLSKELICMALNVYHEARGESVEGQIAVAQVTMNRVEHDNWPNTVCKVVYQNSQFSWTHLKRDHTPYDKTAWTTAVYVAQNVINGYIEEDITNGSVFYHMKNISPAWAKKAATIEQTQIGVHIFYSFRGYW